MSNITPNPLEHFWFMPYSLAVREFLRNSLYLSNYPVDNNVGVYYTTPARAFARFIVPLINGGNLTPMATFTLTSNQPSPGQTPTGWFEKTIVNKETGEWETLRHPLPYEITYRVTIWTTRQSEMDILLYQAMTAAPANRKYAAIVDGQWMELEVKSPQSEGNLEPGESQDVSFRWGFDITIPRAYLPLSYKEGMGVVSGFEEIYDV